MSKIYEKSPAAFEKQCIPTHPSLWKIENDERFLQARRKLLAGNLNDFLGQLAAENQDRYGSTTLLEMIAEGESGDLKFEQSLRWGSTESDQYEKTQSVIMKTIAGFANSEGGTLIIGLSDTGEPIGLEADYATLNGDKDEYGLYLQKLVDNEFGKAFRAKHLVISFPLINETTLCRVDVTPTDASSC